MAAYSLGDMYEKALGVERDDAAALVWFKRGAVLKNAYAIKRMVDYWENKVRQADNQAGVKAAMTELAKLEPKDAVPHEALGRLKTMDTLAANAKALPALAGKPIDPTLCPLTKDDYNLFWWIVSLAAPGAAEDEQDRLASGNVNAKGCLTLNPAGLAAVRKTMALGNTPVLHWAGQGRLLSLVRGPGGKLKFVAEVTGYTE
jgi:TPR repeat protein